MKPYIICHMIASADGRIDCAMVDKISGNEYYTALNLLHCPSTLTGRVTMEHYSAMKELFAATDPTPVGKESFHIATPTDNGYTIAVDTHGRLRWDNSFIDGKPLLCIVSTQTPREYTDRLSADGISWIATGNTAIDLQAAMDMLSRHFGVGRLAILGGGHINGGFLAAGLIDEVSLMIAPGIDGRKGMTAVFDGIADTNRQPVAMRLSSVKQFDNGTVWLRYKL